MPVQQQPMTPMPFYADPNRFTTPVWQTDPAQGWPQGQFIQQIPPAAQPIETYQQYPNGIYQTTYQQPAFEANTFYTGAVQVLTSARPPSVPNQQTQIIPSRPNSNYAHTPSPSPAAQQQNQQQQQQQQQQPATPRQYQEYAQFNAGGEGSQSRPSSVNSGVNQNPPTPNQNFGQQQQQQQVFTSTSDSNFSSGNGSQQNQYGSMGSGNAQPGYPQVNASSPQVASHNSSGYPGSEQYGGQTQQWQQQHDQMQWNQEKINRQQQNYQDQQQQQQQYNVGQQQYSDAHSPVKNQSDPQKTFSQADKVNLNTRIKTMILNKQQNETKMEEEQQHRSADQNSTGHFLWYSHHHHLNPGVGGGPLYNNTERPATGIYDTPHFAQSNFKPRYEPVDYRERPLWSPNVCTPPKSKKCYPGEPVQHKSPPKAGEEIPPCGCFPPDQKPPEPGTYYTHLGCASTLKTLRHNLECQTGTSGAAIRIEKVRYTGKEGKTAQGCPIVKWVHRRVSSEEKYLVIVKHRTGHSCQSAFIVICLVVWDGIGAGNADALYTILTDKLNNFGLPTKRRCATNDTRTCACQGVDEDTCGASFSFGCSWSMYYNGCKFTRSKDVRKFRLSVKEEENGVEERLQELADRIAPMYKRLAPRSFENQCRFEDVARECRLGTVGGRPFSGVTACLDFCAHAHKDIHNMNDGCTAVVTLTKHRHIGKPSAEEEEQLHVLPLYVPDDSDEHGSKENQRVKAKRGEIEVLDRYECEVRTLSEPLPTCRNRKSKDSPRKRKSNQQPSSPPVSSTTLPRSADTPSPYHSPEIQSRHVSSTTVLDPPGWLGSPFPSNFHHLPEFSVFKTPHPYADSYGSYYPCPAPLLSPFTSYRPPINPFEDVYAQPQFPKAYVDVKYTDNSECFKDPEIGGVAIALSHGSVLFECAKHELHATTAVRRPDRRNPTRLSLVFYQHRNLNKCQHGLDEYTLKQKTKAEGVATPYDVGDGVLDPESASYMMRAAASTLPTYSLTTMFPMYPCVVTGPYQEFFAEK